MQTTIAKTMTLAALLLFAACGPGLSGGESSPVEEPTGPDEVGTIESAAKKVRDAGTSPGATTPVTGGQLPTDAGAVTGVDAGPAPTVAPVDAGGAAPPANLDAGTATQDAGAATACLAQPLMTSLGKSHVLLGGMMSDDVAAAAPFDFRYLYLAGGLPDAGEVSCSTAVVNGVACSGAACGWWGCWQDPARAPGDYLKNFLDATQARGQLPVITYYEWLHTSGVAEGATEVHALKDAAALTRFLADWRRVVTTVGSRPALLHLEPDLWGYAQQLSADPRALPAAVTTANPTDCATQENNVAGLAKCMVAMARKYAPNAKVGLHASSWATGVDAFQNRDPSHDIAGNGRKVGEYLVALGANGTDFVVVDPSDRDAAYFDTLGKNRWWDATDATLPNFRQGLAWSSAVSNAARLPSMWWQLPLGHGALPDTAKRWKDNRVAYLLGNPQALAAAGVFAMAFGAGADDQTNPSTDDGHFVTRAKAYLGQGRVPACR